jgi:hypothetical protein
MKDHDGVVCDQTSNDGSKAMPATVMMASMIDSRPEHVAIMN